MRVRVRYIEDIAIIEVEGKVNINSSKLIETVGSLLEGGINKIIIDMQNVDFVDYNGLSVLAIAYKSTLNRKGTMNLCGISLHILELLRIVKLDDVFEIHNSVEEAMEGFKKKDRPCRRDVLKQPLRRRFERLDMDIPIYYRLSRRLSPRGGCELYSGRIANISGAGVFIRTINVFPPGSEVDVDMTLGRRAEKPRSFKGRVLWIADKDLQPDFYPGMGIEFRGLSRYTQEEVIEFVEKNTVHRRG